MTGKRTASWLLAAALAAAVVLLLLLGYAEGSRSAGLRIGVVLNELEGSLTITFVVPGGPAGRAGFQAGDVVLAVNGEPVHSSQDYDRVAKRFQPRQPISYVVQRGGKTFPVTVVPGVPLEVWPFVGDVLASLAYLALALLVLAQPRQDQRTRLLFAFSAAVALELALPTMPVVGRQAIVTFANVAFYVLSALQFSLELHLVSVLPEQPEWLQRRSYLVPALYTVGLSLAVILALLYTCDFHSWPFATGDTSRLRAGILNTLMPLWAVLVIAVLTRTALTHPEPSGRHRAGLVLLGDTPWAVFIFATTAFNLLERPWPAWMEAVQPFVLLAFPIAVFLAIFRYQLFDIEFVVRKSLIYATVTGTLLLAFYAAVGVGSVLFSQFVGGGASLWVVAIATLILGLLFTPLRQRVQGIVDRRFFPERHAMRQRLTSLAADLASLGKLSLMGKHLVAELRGIFQLDSVTLLVADPKSGILLTLATTKTDLDENFGLSFLLSPDDAGVQMLRRTNRAIAAATLIEQSASLAQRLSGFEVEVMVPVTSRGTVIGLLLLGPKVSGGRYSAEEMELLNLFAHHVASVLENARLFASATFDSLTGLLRREAVLDLLERELQRAIRYDRPLTIGMADLDYFKEVNDRFGHLVGDTLLNRVAQSLQSGLRSTDAVGRYGGEEFLLVLPETDLAGARAVAEKVRSTVERISIPVGKNGVIQVTVSIGLATLRPEQRKAAVSVTELIAEADRELFRAKANGRNRIEPAS
jgi:diguanylate cyclase (GGDEF)-like protein